MHISIQPGCVVTRSKYDTSIMRSLCKQRDPDLEVKNSVSETSPSRFLAAQLQGRVWKLEDFEILHELQKPITVVAPGVCQDQHRYHTGPVKKYVRRLNWQHLSK